MNQNRKIFIYRWLISLTKLVAVVASIYALVEIAFFIRKILSTIELEVPQTVPVTIGTIDEEYPVAFPFTEREKLITSGHLQGKDLTYCLKI